MQSLFCITPYEPPLVVPERCIQPSHPPTVSGMAVPPEHASLLTSEPQASAHPLAVLVERSIVAGQLPEGHPVVFAGSKVIQPMFGDHAYPLSAPVAGSSDTRYFGMAVPTAGQPAAALSATPLSSVSQFMLLKLSHPMSDDHA